MFQKIKRFLFHNVTERQTIAKNTFWLAVSDVGGRLLRAAIIIYSARVLGVAEWGVFSYVVGVIALLTIFTDLGVGPVLTREAVKSNDPIERSKIISTSFAIKVALLTFGTVIVVLFAPHFTTIEEARSLFPIAALILIFDTLRGFGASFARSIEKMQWEAGFSLITNFSIVVFGFAALYFFPTARAFLLAYALGTGVGALASLATVKSYLKKLFSYFEWRRVRSILAAAWPIAISGLMGGIMINTDILLVGFFRSAGEVGLYAAAEKPIQAFYLLPAIFAASIFPALSRLAGQNNQKMREVLEKSISITLLISIPIALGGIIVGREFIQALFGQSYGAATLSFQILLVTLIFNFPAVVASNALFASGRERDLFRFAMIGGLSNLALDLILIPPLGIVGSAWATLIAQIISNTYLWRKLRNIVDLEILPALKRIILANILVGIVTIALSANGVNVLLIIVSSIAVYFGALYFLKEPLLTELRLILRGSVSAERANNG